MRALARKLASPFGHPTQVSTQVASTSNFLPVRLASALYVVLFKGIVRWMVYLAGDVVFYCMPTCLCANFVSKLKNERKYRPVKGKILLPISHASKRQQCFPYNLLRRRSSLFINYAHILNSYTVCPGFLKNVLRRNHKDMHSGGEDTHDTSLPLRYIKTR